MIKHCNGSTFRFLLLIGACIALSWGWPASVNAQPGGGKFLSRKPVPPPLPSADGIWETVNRKLMRRLDTEDLSALAVALEHVTPTKDPSELMLRLSVFVRAGDRNQAETAIRSLRRTSMARQRIDEIPGFLVENHEFALARLMLEIFPMAETSCSPALVRYLSTVTPAIDPDKWFVARSRHSGDREFWFRQRMEYCKRLGTQGQLLNELEADLRRHPSDLRRAHFYTNAIIESGLTTNIDWLPTVCKFPLFVENMEFGERLQGSSPKAALSFLERCEALPVTPEDFSWIHTTGQGMLGAAGFPDEKALRDQQRYHLMELYKQTGDNKNALKVMEELSASYSNGLPIGLGQSAGQGQLATGTRVFENRIVAAETENKESMEYWLTRGEYYSGRKEDARATEAFLKAIDLGNKSGHDSQAHCNAATAYSYYLFTSHSYLDSKRWVQAQLDGSTATGEYAEAMAKALIDLERDYFDSLLISHRNDAESWVRSRLADSPVTGAETDRLMKMLLFFPENGFTQLSSTDETLWRYIESNREWTHSEQAVIEQFLRTTDTSVRETVLKRIEKLASNGVPSRELVAARVLRYVGNGDRALPWLENALHNYPAGDTRQQLISDLHSIYLKQHNWRAAESLLPELTPKYEDPNWSMRNCEELALAAANAGDKDDAMGFFKRVVNYNHSLSSRGGVLLQTLGSLGMQEQLRAFYKQMAQQDPNSHIPQDALARLDQPFNTGRRPRI